MPWSSRARIICSNGSGPKRVESFSYPTVAAAPVAEGAPAAKPTAPQEVPGIELLFTEPPPAEASVSITGQDLEDREKRGFQAGLEQGVSKGQAQAGAEFEKRLAEERAKVGTALEDFLKEKDAYYQSVEPQVVHLALSIARKVLHRELQVDPLALTGVVRVTLEKLAGGSDVKLRVPAPHAAGWKQAVRPQDCPNIRFEIVPDDLLDGPQCRIETETGTTDLSVDSQLDEIERGFLDLVQHRPGK
jgi:flagellar assembly protein FliH